MQSLKNKVQIRAYRKMKFNKRRKNDLEKPRLCIFKSNKHFQAQLIDDKSAKVLASVASFQKEYKTLNLTGKEQASHLGKVLAEKIVAIGIKTVVFDRNGFLYHGRVKEFADSARTNGLSF